MIITRISGGLGNQLFQYALGKSLSKISGQAFTIDTHFYKTGLEPDRFYTLDRFAITAKIAMPADFRKIGVPDPERQDLYAKATRALFRMTERMKPPIARRFIIEPDFRFHPEILQIRGDVYLSGVWQSEKYFIEVASDLRKEFILREPLSDGASALLREIQASSSIALHVRRGDQLEPQAVQKYGVLTNDYYAAATAYIEKRVSNPHYFIFSDDIEWVQENLDVGPNVTYIGQSLIPDYEALTLMASCNHVITAKSSFSWWGAWLCANPQKIVITPAEQFGTSAGIDDKDLIPPSWVRL